MGVLGEYMVDYWVIEKGWVIGWYVYDDGMDGKWSVFVVDYSVLCKFNDGVLMMFLWLLVL